MINGLWGRKIGMTQVFAQDAVVPVTVIDVAHWRVTRIKTVERDGYAALQVGCVRQRYTEEQFSEGWLKQAKKYFSALKEIKLNSDSDFTIGQLVDSVQILNEGEAIDAFGITKGCGFAGAVRRHGFSGGRASHGSKFGRFPGSLGGFRSQGRVAKGKKLPGHMGVDQRVMKNLKVVRTNPEAHVILIKGSVPGKAGSLVFLRKRG